MAASKNSPTFSSMVSSRPNLTDRNSESKDPMRRCFSGNPCTKPSSIVTNSRGGFNPNTPVNSPSDFPSRSSFGRENSSSLRDYEEKENSKSLNLRPGRVPSPASASKGTKNFMSPTISAASKVTTSPRKKFLVERNELFRSSVLFPDAKNQVMEDSNVKPENCSNKKKTVSFADVICLLTEDETCRSSVSFPNAKDQVMEDNNVKTDICSNKMKTVAFADAISQSTDDDYLSKPEMSFKEKKIDASLDSTVTDMACEEALKSDSDLDSVVPVDLQNDIDSSWENVTEKDCVNLDPTFKISPRTSCSTASPNLAPLDANPLMPPYDPKTNYLSPRPLFLHYKPNPRIELLRNQDGKRLDESFISENLSDSEVSETLSDETQKDSEDVSSDETVEEEEEINVPADKPKEIVQSKVGSKSKYFTKSKFVALLLALVFAFMVISVSDSRATNLSALKDLSLYDLYIPPEIPEIAKVKFERLVRKSRLWAVDSFSFICELISELRGVHKLGHLQSSNLSALLDENHLVDGYLKFAGAEFNNKENLMAPTGERDVKTEQLGESNPETEENEEDNEDVSEEYNSAGFEEQVQQDIEADDNIEEVLEDHTEPESEEVCLTSLAEVIKPADVEAVLTEETVHSDVKNDIKLQSNIDVTDKPVEISEITEIQSFVREAKEPQVEREKNSYAEIDSTKAGENTKNTELDASLDDNPIPAAVHKFVTRNVVGISSLVLLSLLVGTVFSFNHAKKGKLSTPNVNTPMEQSVMTKKLDYSPISVTVEHKFEQKLASRKWQTNVDISGESASSEMSSFKSSYQSKKGLKTSRAAKSPERKHRKNYRRESLASSDCSLSSTSYGSFTTYEKIPSKHGYGDEEVVTPVRRSSRIRNLATPP